MLLGANAGLPAWSGLQLGTNDTLPDSISSFLLTHSCFYLKTCLSSVLSNNVRKITGSRFLIMYVF